MSYSEAYDPLEGIAIVGMAGRFPGARNVDELWRNLLARPRNASRTSRPTSSSPRTPKTWRSRQIHPTCARAVFSRTSTCSTRASSASIRKEAEVLDPQQRLFLEAAWEALEHAGYDPQDVRRGPIGVFAGATQQQLLPAEPAVAARRHRHRRLLTTQMAQRERLRGHARRVQVRPERPGAQHPDGVLDVPGRGMHCRAEPAVATSATWRWPAASRSQLPQKRGYLYAGRLDPLARRALPRFDRDAGGTVFSNGLGVVVLRRLRDALEDGDTIYAVIKGAALNNDGSSKVSFTAPSVDGHAQVIAMAQALAGIDPQTISYIEAHGTGTSLGDPIEIAGLTQAFRAGGATGNGFCAHRFGEDQYRPSRRGGRRRRAHQGSAGAAPQDPAGEPATSPSPNPKLDIAEHAVLRQRNAARMACGTPRRAAPASVRSAWAARTRMWFSRKHRRSNRSMRCRVPSSCCCFRRAMPDALERAAARLRDHLVENEQADLADMRLHAADRTARFRSPPLAHVPQPRRCHRTADARRSEARSRFQRRCQPRARRIHVSRARARSTSTWGARSTNRRSRFRYEIDACAAVLLPFLGVDLRAVLYPDGRSQRGSAGADSPRRPSPSRRCSPSNTRLRRCGCPGESKPTALIGHSVGEYVAACSAARSRAMPHLPLLAQRARADAGDALRCDARSARFGDANPPRSGTAHVDRRTECAESDRHLGRSRGHRAARRQRSRQRASQAAVLPTSHAFHSPMMEPVVERFTAIVRQEPRRASRQRFLGVRVSPADSSPMTKPPTLPTGPASCASLSGFMDGIGELIDISSRCSKSDPVRR